MAGKFITNFLAVLVCSMLFWGCSSDRSGPSNAYPAGAIQLIIEPGRFTENQKERMICAAEVHSEFLVAFMAPVLPPGTETHITFGDHIIFDGVAYDGVWDFWNGVIRIPASPAIGFHLAVLWHELMHRIAPRDKGYDACHCSVWDWVEIGRTQGLIVQEIDKRWAEKGL
jgi:hypothetical protein